MATKRTITPAAHHVTAARMGYALYLIKVRSHVKLTDGLAGAARRALWTARSGAKVKTATLAGATMPLHPHQECGGVISNLAGPHKNNIPLFTGEGNFGTMIAPNAMGAPRYTTVYVSQFTKDAILVDLDIVPMQPNYDGTLEEPRHFLPLIPVCLVNPHDGTSIGYASHILPRKLSDIITAQIEYLTKGRVESPLLPTFTPLDNMVGQPKTSTTDSTRFEFTGCVEIKDTTRAVVTVLPYEMEHRSFVQFLAELMEQEDSNIVDVVDHTRGQTNIEIKFKRATLRGKTQADVIRMLGLKTTACEQLNVVAEHETGMVNLTAQQVVEQFTEWRLGWYVKRYERLLESTRVDLQRFIDLRTAIDNDAGGQSRQAKTRQTFKTFLEELKIVHLDYIADMPVYRFTQEEYTKNEQRIKKTEKLIREYEGLIKSPQKRKAVYIEELTQLLTNFEAGKYASKGE